MKDCTKKYADWARKQKRVTNKSLRESFNIDEDMAALAYAWLKAEGIVGRLGYVGLDVKEGYEFKVSFPSDLDKTIPEFTKSLRDLADVLDNVAESKLMKDVEVSSLWSDGLYGLKMDGDVQPLNLILHENYTIGDRQYQVCGNAVSCQRLIGRRKDGRNTTWLSIDRNLAESAKEPDITIGDILRRDMDMHVESMKRWQEEDE